MEQKHVRPPFTAYYVGGKISIVLFVLGTICIFGGISASFVDFLGLEDLTHYIVLTGLGAFALMLVIDEIRGRIEARRIENMYK